MAIRMGPSRTLTLVLTALSCLAYPSECASSADGSGWNRNNIIQLATLLTGIPALLVALIGIVAAARKYRRQHRQQEPVRDDLQLQSESARRTQNKVVPNCSLAAQRPNTESMHVDVARPQQVLLRSDPSSSSQFGTTVPSMYGDVACCRQHRMDETTPSVSNNVVREMRTTSEMQASLPVAHISQPASLTNTRPPTLAEAESVYQLVVWFQEIYHDLDVQQIEERGVWEREMEGWTESSFHDGT
ncbi:hypothetical protein EV356DRAFT_516415 [Viridothelium virens]|uniref:Uncharacterized protein n=1 Tax=Viridothelium virens TaxID=1048519 RepID=A0A6A6H627_VIRVR|nr:hypothetical protein EV356DRAFT_516415 [Viridothelium virens]